MPYIMGFSRRNAENLRSLVHRASREEPKLDQFRGLLVRFNKFFQRVVERQQVVGALRCGNVRLVELEAIAPSTSL